MTDQAPEPPLDPPATRRLFIGLRLAEEEGQRLMRRLRPHFEDSEGLTSPGTRIYEPLDLHLTLCYLGPFPEARRKLLQRILQEEIRGMDAPELALTGIGAFPSLEQPRAVWVGVREGDERPGRLQTLHNRAWQAARSMGWRPSAHEHQREFRPHLTVARHSNSAADEGLPRTLTSLEFSHSWLPIEVCLLESRPDHPEERYQTLAAIPLVVRPG